MVLCNAFSFSEDRAAEVNIMLQSKRITLQITSTDIYGPMDVMLHLGLRKLCWNPTSTLGSVGDFKQITISGSSQWIQ